LLRDSPEGWERPSRGGEHKDSIPVLKHLLDRRANRTFWEQGFTLVELLVVIVILGILAAVVVFAVGGTEQNAKVKSCLAERNTLEAAVISFQSAAESNPALGTSVTVSALENADPPFLKHNPKYWDVNTDGSLTRINDGQPPASLCDNDTNG
jgi:general secretion pathway protein G